MSNKEFKGDSVGDMFMGVMVVVLCLLLIFLWYLLNETIAERTSLRDEVIELQRILVKKAMEEYLTKLNISPTKPRSKELHIPEPLRAKLVRLCHPDKHSNSTLSNEITQLLNGMKKR